MPRKTKSSKDNTAIIVAIIAATATLLTAIISLVSPFVERMASEDISIPTTVVTPTLTASIYPLILRDEFDINMGLPVWHDAGAFGEIVDGVYRIGVTAPNVAIWRHYDRLEVSDFYVKVDVIIPISTKSYSAGIAFRDDNNGDYLFGINNNKQFEFLNRTRSENGGLTTNTLINWLGDSAIQSYGKNTLEIIAQKDTFELVINSVKVKTIVESTHSKGEIGFYVSTYGGGQEVIVEFDNLIIEER